MELFKFGEKAEGFEIPVLNEREIRAAAGLLFLFVFISIQRVIYFWDFTLLRYVSSFFLADFIIRIFISPRYSPSLILGRLIVRNQTPEYVGAEQKKFAWVIGLIMGLTMFVSLNILNIHSPITGIICMICQIFLFFEAVFGICLGCLLYPLVFRKKPQYCPGEVCDPKAKQLIQMTSTRQVIALILFIAIFTALVPTLKESFSKEPELAMGMKKPPQIKN
jgi:hypothetical protein